MLPLLTDETAGTLATIYSSGLSSTKKGPKLGRYIYQSIFLLPLILSLFNNAGFGQ